jgi:predicted AAA+ superfamily ATPase
MSRTYIPRIQEINLKKAAKQFPAIVVTGPRQTGKTTLLQHCFPKYNRVTLDDPVLRRSCKEEPELFLENYPPPCLIDEIQYAPQLLPHIKMQIDKNRDQMGQYIMTGSQIFPLIQGLTESLAGRIAIFELQGISLAEFSLPKYDQSTLFERIFTGSYPDPLIHLVHRETYYSSYMQTYLERDIRQIENVRDLSYFQHFVELLASRTGNLLNQSELAKESGVKQPTISRWISLLENSGIVFLLRPYSKNLNKRVVKTPKIYFHDTGLLTYLLRYPDYQTLSKGPINGAVFENFIIAELIKDKINNNRNQEFYFYRDSNKNEIDLVIDRGLDQILCEIKLSKNIQKKHYSTLEKQQVHFINPKCYVISAMEQEILLTKEIENVPFIKGTNILNSKGL